MLKQIVETITIIKKIKNNLCPLFIMPSRHTLRNVVYQLTEFAKRYNHPLSLQHYAALLNSKGQILTMGTNSLHHHAEVDAIDRYLSRLRFPRQWVLSSPRPCRRRTFSDAKGPSKEEKEKKQQINFSRDTSLTFQKTYGQL